MGSIFATLNIEIIGEITEYNPYEEKIRFNYSCNDEIIFSFPKNAKNIHYLNKTQINDISNFTISDCNNVTEISYILDIVEKTNSDEQRLERRFSNLDNISYTYSLEIEHEYLINNTTSIPKNQSISINEKATRIDFQKSDVYLIYYSKPEKEENNVSTTKFFEEITEFWVIILMIIFFVLGFLTAYLIYKKNTSNIMSGHVPSYVLTKEEKLILTVIEKNPGINQKLIGDELNFSKARVSAFVNELEQKGIIRRERFGRSFKVYLNKKII